MSCTPQTVVDYRFAPFFDGQSKRGRASEALRRMVEDYEKAYSHVVIASHYAN